MTACGVGNVEGTNRRRRVWRFWRYHLDDDDDDDDDDGDDYDDDDLYMMMMRTASVCV